MVTMYEMYASILNERLQKEKLERKLKERKKKDNLNSGKKGEQ